MLGHPRRTPVQDEEAQPLQALVPAVVLQPVLAPVAARLCSVWVPALTNLSVVRLVGFTAKTALGTGPTDGRGNLFLLHDLFKQVANKRTAELLRENRSHRSSCKAVGCHTLENSVGNHAQATFRCCS